VNPNQKKLAKAVRAACLQAARDASEDARMSGLCADGALEAALGAIEMLDVDSLPVSDAQDPGGNGKSPSNT
jgi:hypothetical protein